VINIICNIDHYVYCCVIDWNYIIPIHNGMAPIKGRLLRFPPFKRALNSDLICELQNYWSHNHAADSMTAVTTHT